MKKIILIIILLSFIGCAYIPGQQAPAEEPTTYTEEYRTGPDGLRLEFIPNIPPAKLYDTEPFAAMIELTNEGASQVGGPGDRIYLSGFDPALIIGIPTTGVQIPIIEGRSLYVREPGMDSVVFKGTLRDITRMRMDRYTTTIVATACYAYETIANTGVCIDPDPYSPTAKQKVCTPGDVALGTQGAPIAIEGVDVIPSKGTTRFRIHISNVGQGNVFRNGIEYLQKCSPYSTGLEFDDIDYVQVGDVMVSGTNIRQTCKPLDAKGHVRLTNGRATIICELKNIRGQTPYTTPLSITLNYGYRDAIFQTLEILPSG